MTSPKRPPKYTAGTPIHIGIDVQTDGLKITLWRGSERNAVYFKQSKEQALARALPEAIDEALAFAQASSAELVTE